MEKPTTGEKFRALLATGRVANLPTVWSNVLVAFWIASYLTEKYNGDEVVTSARYFLLALTCLIASCIYIAGCMLGDACDIEFDRKNRPNRPLPQGVLSASTIKFSAYCIFGVAIFVMFSATLISFVGAVYIHENLPLRDILTLFSSKSSLAAIQLHELLIGCALIASVITYAHFHKRVGKFAIFLMATCRFMLVVYAIACAHKSFFLYSYSSSDPIFLHADWFSNWMFILAAAVGAYTLLLSWVASTESDKRRFQKRTFLSILLLAVPLLTFAFQHLIISPHPKDLYWNNHGDLMLLGNENLAFGTFLTAMIALYLWLGLALQKLRTSKPAFVSRALAGFCLLDAAFIAPFFPTIALVCAALFGLALLLQRITPAT